MPLAEQDRGRWDGRLIAEGVDLISRTLAKGQVGPHQLQAAIAAVHDEAESAEATDWPQILVLYELLERTGENPVITLNRAVAVAMVHGPEAGLELLMRPGGGQAPRPPPPAPCDARAPPRTPRRRRERGGRLPRGGPARDERSRAPPSDGAGTPVGMRGSGRRVRDDACAPTLART